MTTTGIPRDKCGSCGSESQSCNAGSTIERHHCRAVAHAASIVDSLALNQAADALCLALWRSLDGLGGVKPGKTWIRYEGGWWHCGVECLSFDDEQSSREQFESMERELPKAALSALREVEEWRDEAARHFEKDRSQCERSEALVSRLGQALDEKYVCVAQDGSITVRPETMERLLNAFDRLVKLQGRDDGGES
jgi:hypothetical protein